MAEETNIDLAAFLLNPEFNEAKKPETKPLAPTPENLLAALGKASVETRKHLHTHSNIEFKIRAMSSDGYNALDNVTQINPMTGFPMSTASEDAFERQIIFLTYGVAQPALSREQAIGVLKHPGWGPSNISLIDAIKELNPSAEERANNFILLMQANRFNVILFHILDEIGALDDICDKYDVTDNVRLALKTCIASFRALFKVQFAAQAWGIPLTTEGLINEVVDPNKDAAPVEELAENYEVGEKGPELLVPKEEADNGSTKKHKKDSPQEGN